MFSSKTRQVIKTFSRFKDTVFSGEYRYDGKLLVAADALGLVSIFDAYQPRSLLISLLPSSHPTHVAKFHPSIGNQLVTGSDDRSLRLYDISDSSSGPVTQFDHTNHGDYIRSVNFIPGNPNLITTGCYDGYVRIFDTRLLLLVAKFNNHTPVEDVLALSPTTLVSAGGPQVKVWDLSRGLQIHEFNNFTKTATTLHNTGDHGLLVGSLDGHVKIFDYGSTNWDVKFGWKFESGGVLCSAVSPNFKHFATGLSSGLLSIRTRKMEAKITTEKAKKTSNYARLTKGADYHGDDDEQVVVSSSSSSKKLKTFERHLNAFKWAEALDSAVTQGVNRDETITLLNELKKRGKVRIAMHGRDEISLMPILLWLIRSLGDVRSFNIVCDFLAVISEMYGTLIYRSIELEEAFGTLAQRVSSEITKSKEANEICGMLELLAN